MLQKIMILACAVSAVLAGTCHPINPPTDIDINAFAGKWNVIHYKSDTGAFHGVRCFAVQFQPQFDDEQVAVNVTGVFSDGSHLLLTSVCKLTVFGVQSVCTIPFGDEMVDTYILGSDYETYAVMYSCHEKHQLGESIYLMSRDTRMGYDTLMQALGVLSSNGITGTLFHIIDHHNC